MSEGEKLSIDTAMLTDEKKKRLAELKEFVDHIADGVGYPIEEGIKEPVIYLNALGFNTAESCEGHSNAGWIGPWIGIAPEYPETDRWSEDRATVQKITEEGMSQLAKVEKLLEEFNANRAVPEDQRLILWRKGIYGGLRIQNQGMNRDIPDKEDLNAREEKLNRYREEMKQFTEFIKNKYLMS